MTTSSLQGSLRELLSNRAGPVLFLGQAAQVLQLRPDGERPVIIDPVTRPSKLRPYHSQSLILRGAVDHLPVRPASVGVLVAVRMLGQTEEPGVLLGRWAELLRPEGLLILVEPDPGASLITGIRRLVGPSRTSLRPEDLCALLLNAGLDQVSQRGPLGHPRGVVTFGLRRSY